MPCFGASSREIDFTSVLFHDAISLSERASQVFWRHNQADRKRGFFDSRFDKRLNHGVCVEVIYVLLVAIRDRDLLELFERFDWHTFLSVRIRDKCTCEGAIVRHVCIWAGR